MEVPYVVLLSLLSLVRAFLSEDNLTETDPCPLVLKSNHSNTCECGSEIICYHLDAVPIFVPNDRIFRVIDFRRQDIRVIPENSFFRIQVLKVTLDFNPIGNRLSENAFAGLDGFLQELSLASCSISDLPPGLLSGMNELQHIHLWNNNIRAIPNNFFEPATKLVEISLWGNHIKYLHKNMFIGLWNLKRLDLDHNRINHLAGEHFSYLGNLEGLHLGHNRLRSLLHNSFKPLRKLKVLNLDHNNLGYFYGDAFNGLGRLLSLSLNHNNIQLLTDNQFSPLLRLKHLFLQNNQLKNSLWAIHLSGLQSLLSLDLSSNHISELPKLMFEHTPGLRQLSLDNNLLASVPRSLFPNQTHLVALSLLGNPLHCVCDMAWIPRLPEATVWGSCVNATGSSQSVDDPLTFRGPC